MILSIIIKPNCSKKPLEQRRALAARPVRACFPEALCLQSPCSGAIDEFLSSVCVCSGNEKADWPLKTPPREKKLRTAASNPPKSAFLYGSDRSQSDAPGCTWLDWLYVSHDNWKSFHQTDKAKSWLFEPSQVSGLSQLSHERLAPWQSSTFFTLRVTEPWQRLCREVMELPSLEMFKHQLDLILCNLLYRALGQDDLQRSLFTPATPWTHLKWAASLYPATISLRKHCGTLSYYKEYCCIAAEHSFDHFR